MGNRAAVVYPFFCRFSACAPAAEVSRNPGRRIGRCRGRTPGVPPRPAEDKSSLIDNLLGENAESLKSFFVSNAQAAKIYYQLWRSKKANRLPLIVLTSFRLLVVAFFIVTVVHQFLTENQKVTLILLVASVALISRSKWLLSQYLKMEAQFLDNLKGSAPEKDDDPSE